MADATKLIGRPYAPPMTFGSPPVAYLFPPVATSTGSPTSLWGLIRTRIIVGFPSPTGPKRCQRRSSASDPNPALEIAGRCPTLMRPAKANSTASRLGFAGPHPVATLSGEAIGLLTRAVRLFLLSAPIQVVVERLHVCFGSKAEVRSGAH